MFKTAATKFAHNSTIPSLGGNTELRPLQDLITAEKAVLISYVDRSGVPIDRNVTCCVGCKSLVLTSRKRQKLCERGG